MVSPVEMRLLCPACQTPLPALAMGADAIPCTACGVEVDAARLATVAGKPRLVAERDFTGIGLDGLRVAERIGAGGMGSVYRAVGDDGAVCAVKFLSPAMAALPEVVERFRREIKLLATLDHPRIVKVRGQGQVEGIPWFAMDLVEGPTLAARLAQGPLTVAEARGIFPSLFEALAHAHGRGVVHRDLKPANVLLSDNGPAIADFGIAHLDLDLATRKTQLTQTHAILGTYPYMSPEQRAGRPVDHRSDLYSMGVLVYEALSGTRPEGAFSPLHELRPEIPLTMDGLVSRLLQPNREVRLGSASEAATLFAAAWAPRKRGRMGKLLGVVLVFASASAWLVWGGGKSFPPASNEVSKPTVELPAIPKELPPPPTRQAVAPEVEVAVPAKNLAVDSLPESQAIQGKLGTKAKAARRAPMAAKPSSSDAMKKSGKFSKAKMAEEDLFLDSMKGKANQPGPKFAPKLEPERKATKSFGK
jgi:serine/threonine protein kinase